MLCKRADFREIGSGALVQKLKIKPAVQTGRAEVGTNDMHTDGFVFGNDDGADHAALGVANMIPSLTVIGEPGEFENAFKYLPSYGRYPRH